MSPVLPARGDAFFADAPLVVSATISLPHSQDQVWAAISGDAMGAWIGAIDRSAWLTPPPRRAGGRRTVRIARILTLHEEFSVWEPPHRAAFHVTALSRARPRIRGWAEDFRLQSGAGGIGTRLTWTFAMDSRLRLPRPLRPVAEAACRRLMLGITSILGPPEHGFTQR